MLEIVLFCVILLAAGYWATMFVMGRRDDVIHGKFVHTEEEGDFTPAAMPAPPPFPKRPVRVAQPASVRTASVQPALPEAKPVNSAALQSLLAAIQQDLKSVA
ncbi:hypothetical protein [Bradyrhizobium sp. CCBAU 45389]|uniref:hypothetical protein n=1 Tax=Bradyrhizobium sp. CCBAU 45389 TaxID=858429 RepID=UPI002306B03B|nr:hypothetical protein [Bradyrhizobium sp. CCBAU 45389]MDA9397269.1 hypothetical protein [Bradyrhizobium sp. CCBAU 45389]